LYKLQAPQNLDPTPEAITGNFGPFPKEFRVLWSTTNPFIYSDCGLPGCDTMQSYG